jgi:membrane-associated protein
VAFNVFGGIGWVFSLVTLGYLLGNVSLVKNNFEKVILLIIFLSILPVIIEIVKHKLAARNPRPEEVPMGSVDPLP